VSNMSELLRLAVEAGLSDIHTCMPATIEKYDFEHQKASVKPSIKKAYRDGEIAEMPVIEGVPVVFPRSGGASLTFPVNQGDAVMLLFSERSLENWLIEGGEQEPGDPRRMDLTDAIAIPGLYSFKETSPQKNNTDVQLQYKGGQYVINASGRIALGNQTGELIDILQQIVLAIETSICIPFSPLTGFPALEALRARLALIGGNLP
jgi:hypothetical protein